MQHQTGAAPSPVLAAGARSLRLHLSGDVEHTPPSPVGSPLPFSTPDGVPAVSTPVRSGCGAAAISPSHARVPQPCLDNGSRSPRGHMHTPKRTKKRRSGHSGQLRTSGGMSRTGRRRAKKRSRARTSSAVDLVGVPFINGRLADEEYRQQQRQAREERGRRREREFARHDRVRVQRSKAPTRRHSDGHVISGRSTFQPLCEGRRRSEAGRRRSMSRRRLCGRNACGWRPSGPGMTCIDCPGGIVHNEGDGLCFACHRALDDSGVTHLGEARLPLAVELVTRVRAGGRGMPEAILSRFQPTSDCLCQRTDCFAAFLKSEERSASKAAGRVCGVCSRSGQDIQWHNVRNPAALSCAEGANASGAASPPPSLVCKACHLRRVRATEGSSVAIPAAAGAKRASPKVTAIDRVRNKLRGKIDDGRVVYWEEAAEWLRRERQKDDETEWTRDYLRRLVASTFKEVADESGGNAIVFNSNLGCLSGRDRRRVHLALLPVANRDDILLRYHLEAREKAEAFADAGTDSDGEKTAAFRAQLKAVLQDKDDVPTRMAVVRAAGGIVRGDIRRQKSLENVPRVGAKHNCANELNTKIAPLLETLWSLPPSLVGFLQTVTNLRMLPETDGPEVENQGDGWVWGTEGPGREERSESTRGGCAEGHEEDADIDVEAESEDGIPGWSKGDEESGGAFPTCATSLLPQDRSEQSSELEIGFICVWDRNFPADPHYVDEADVV